MYCPRCGDERLSQATSFCSRCGFLLTVTSELIPTGGMLPTTYVTSSPRSRGVKQGLFIFLLGLLLFPILGTISIFALRPAGMALFLLSAGALLRIIYALVFEPKAPLSLGAERMRGVGAANEELPGHIYHETLPPAQSRPASQYTSPQPGHWRDTKDLEPASVTEPTTKLLEKDSKLSS